MGILTQKQINIDLFNEVKRLNKQVTELTAERNRVKRNIDLLADQYKELEHKNKLLNMALRAANNGNDSDDLRYAYEPNKGIEQLKTVCNGVIVHIPVDWFTEIVDELTARAEQAEAREKGLRAAINFVINTFKKDIQQGYKTKDKEFAIEVLSKALAGEGKA